MHWESGVLIEWQFRQPGHWGCHYTLKLTSWRSPFCLWWREGFIFHGLFVCVIRHSSPSPNCQSSVPHKINNTCVFDKYVFFSSVSHFCCLWFWIIEYEQRHGEFVLCLTLAFFMKEEVKSEQLYGFLGRMCFCACRLFFIFVLYFICFLWQQLLWNDNLAE